jgi:hypothetical protein
MEYAIIDSENILYYNQRGKAMKPTPKKIILNVPASVVETIDKVASRRMQSRSTYIREAVRVALERDGLSVIAA